MTTEMNTQDATHCRLQVMICTFGDDGLDRVAAMDLPHIKGVQWLVSCQSSPRELPQVLVRDDVSVSFTPTRGLSANRNHAISLLTAPYALIADDDLTYYADGLTNVIEAFDANPDLDLATFRCTFGDGRKRPDESFDLAKKRKFYSPLSVEIAFRTSLVRDNGLRFDEHFGIGAPYLNCGEEDVFAHQCKQRMRRGRYFPITIAHHAGHTSSQKRRLDPATLRSKGAVMAVIHPITCWLRAPLEAHRSAMPFFSALTNYIKGVIYRYKTAK